MREGPSFCGYRLIREARSAGTLSHPGIVIVHDVGQEDDLAFIAMEYVELKTTRFLVSQPGETPRLWLDRAGRAGISSTSRLDLKR
jgi:serine/threonine protein kinase